MEVLSPFVKRNKRPVPLLDPCRFVRDADLALARGDREEAVLLIQQAYLAFDLCANWCCERVRAAGKDRSERNS